MNKNKRKPSSSKDVRRKVNSGLNRKNDISQKRIQSSISADKSFDSSGNLTEQLNNIVKDYLLRQNCIKTLEQFKIESQFINEQSNQSEHIILGHFDRGERDKFFKLWKQIINQLYFPISQRQDNDSRKLQFYIQTYFFIYPIHPIFKKNGYLDKDSINQFKSYIDKNAGDLSNEVLSFFALPYIKNPETHQSFQHLFTHQWVSDLRMKLKEFLQSKQESEKQGSILKRLVLSQEASMNYQQQDHQKRILEMKQLQQENMELKKKNNQQIQSIEESSLQAQKKWFLLAGELFNLQKEMLLYIEKNKKILNMFKINLISQQQIK